MTILPFLIIVFFISWILQYVYLQSSRIGISDIPNERSMHSAPVKKSGGIIFISVFAASAAIFYPELAFRMTSLTAGFVFIFATGILDDLYNLGSKTRFASELAVFTAIAYVWNPEFAVFGYTIPAHLGPLFLAVYFIGIINIVNFMDGMDLYLVGTVLTAMIVSFFTFDPLLLLLISPLFLILAAAISSFAAFNAPRARLFMGDSGSLPLGFLIALLPFLQQEPAELSRIYLIIPVFLTDGALTILKRLYERKNILNAHREHLYQVAAQRLLSRKSVPVLFSLWNLTGLFFINSSPNYTLLYFVVNMLVYVIMYRKSL